MIWLTWLMIVIAIVSFTLFAFVGKEILKKFKVIAPFVHRAGYTQNLQYFWKGSKLKGMQNIVLRSDEPFEVIIGFTLRIPIINFSGIDPFGYVEAKERGNGGYYAVISTFLWKTQVLFSLWIKTKKEQKIEILPIEESQSYKPHLICNPHIYQKLGFY